MERTQQTFKNEHGVCATVKIHWVGKYHYWMEINGCQESKVQSIPNPWKKDCTNDFLSTPDKKKLLQDELTWEGLERAREEERKDLKIN